MRVRVSTFLFSGKSGFRRIGSSKLASISENENVLEDIKNVFIFHKFQ